MIANGGTCGTSDRQPIECYDPRTRTWPASWTEADIKEPQVLPQQMMAARLELTQALAKVLEDNKRLRAELHDVQAELHHVHQTGNRLEADRATLEKLSLERWNEFQVLKEINKQLRTKIKVLQDTVASLTQKIDQQAAELCLQKERDAEQDTKLLQQAAEHYLLREASAERNKKLLDIEARLSQVEVELQNRKPLQAAIALGQMQTGLNNSYRDFWALFFDKNTTKQVPVFMSISAMLRHRRETPNKRITTDHDAAALMHL
jgi:hypothetical protein